MFYINIDCENLNCYKMSILQMSILKRFNSTLYLTQVNQFKNFGVETSITFYNIVLDYKNLNLFDTF